MKKTSLNFFKKREQKLSMFLEKKFNFLKTFFLTFLEIQCQHVITQFFFRFVSVFHNFTTIHISCFLFYSFGIFIKLIESSLLLALNLKWQKNTKNSISRRKTYSANFVTVKQTKNSQKHNFLHQLPSLNEIKDSFIFLFYPPLRTHVTSLNSIYSSLKSLFEWISRTLWK